MQQLNDHMDDLFKRAGKNYPLKTDTADWETVRDRLSTGKSFIQFFKKNNYRHKVLRFTFSFLLLLIPLTIAVTKYFSTSSGGIQNLDTGTDSKKFQVAPDLLSLNMPMNVQAIYGKANNSNKNKNPLTAIDNNKNKLPGKIEKEINVPLLVPENNTAYNNKDVVTDSYPDNNEITKSLLEKDLKKAKSTDQENLKPKKTPKIIRPNSFYAGFLVAPEISSIKFQRFSKPGFNLGFVAGYNLNNRLQVEIGASISHKYYYSDGKYVPAKTLRRDNSNIASINVVNNITEIPLTARYNITPAANNKFFVSTGLVSYIIHKENYNYLYTKNGEEKQGVRKYNKSIGNVFSNVQVSFGYQHTLGKIGDMRIEPYYRVPLNGVGVSNLPVTGIGVNFALTKYFK